jgi:Mg-chelatase subunit ChlI
MTIEFDLDNYQPTPVAYELRASILQKVRRGEDPLTDIQGREETKRDVLRALLSGYNLYLVSEEGTGKTRLAKSLTRLLSPIPRIKGCLYNDDPKWPAYLLCPRCRDSQYPVEEYGIELVSGGRRFSRIQGNDYTDEAKLLGLKDIQAIIEGKSPTDARVFVAGGAFRANRGILFIDELPAIRTKVQVLLHPILEEKKIILEEYNWEYPLDIILIATGNPQGFSHVNEVPRPLLDRLELIYMPLPSKEVEREIMLRERFRTKENYFELPEEEQDYVAQITPEEVERDVILPWWLTYLLNEAITYSRKCSLLDRKPSLRGSRALDHTYASAELDKRKVACLKDACDGLKLALRGRMELRPDLIDFENPAESFKRTDELSEDLLWNAVENSVALFLEGCDREKLANNLRSLASEGMQNLTSKLRRYEELNRIVERLKRLATQKISSEFLTKQESELFCHYTSATEEIVEQYNYSAVEVISNMALHCNLITEAEIRGKVFVPSMVSWAK